MRYAAFLASTVFALPLFQDPVVVRPHLISVAFENARIRVLRVRLGPHDRIETHSHPGLVVIPLTAGSRRILSLDGSHWDSFATVGDAQWRDSATHAEENLIDTPSENIEIEFKNVSAPAISVAQAEIASASPNSAEPVPVNREPYHHVVLENQYVRVVDVNIPPGQTTLFHTHESDNFSVRISGGLTQAQMQGKDWNPPKQNERGSVNFSGGSTKPYTHRIKNLGPDTYHVIDVEILP
jgi:quercetin dioxygenase-like cupin family protein